MTKFQYPSLIRGVWRWAEANITSTKEMHAVAPCIEGKCEGHRTQLRAVLHHASDFCAKAELTYIDKPDEKQKCIGCGAWTIHRVAFHGCPFDDFLVVCSECEPRGLLRRNHYSRRALSEWYRGERLLPALPISEPELATEFRVHAQVP